MDPPGKNEGIDIDSINEVIDNDTLLGPSETSSLSTPTEIEANCFDDLKLFRLKYPRNVIISYININSIRNKFSGFSEMIGENVDILVIAETKIDSSFPTSQFLIDGFKSPYRLDVSGNSGGILVTQGNKGRKGISLEALFKTSVRGRIRNFTEYNEKLSKRL